MFPVVSVASAAQHSVGRPQIEVNMLQYPLAIVTFLTLFGLTSIGAGYAASNRDDYDLQERCGKRAEESFRRDWGEGIKNTDSGPMIADYRNHYNRKLNKCFVLLSVLTGQNKNKKEKNGGVSRSIMLYDINESRMYGNFLQFEFGRPPIQCHVFDKKCQSEDEWNSLVSPYMEE